MSLTCCAASQTSHVCVATACRIFKAVEWLLLRSLVVFKGYDTYIEVFYIIAGVVFATVLLTVWVAVVLKGSDSVNPWLKRWEPGSRTRMHACGRLACNCSKHA